MSNYVSKENAIGLKEIGFDVPLCAYYDGEDFHYADFPMSNNADDDFPSAPDFLTAADWLFRTYEIATYFFTSTTHIISIEGAKAFGRKKPRDKSDHRNTALSHAIQIVKNRR